MDLASSDSLALPKVGSLCRSRLHTLMCNVSHRATGKPCLCARATCRSRSSQTKRERIERTFAEVGMWVAVVAQSIAGHLGLLQVPGRGFVHSARAALHHHVVLRFLIARQYFKSLPLVPDSDAMQRALTLYRTGKPSRPDNGIAVVPIEGLTTVLGFDWRSHLLMHANSIPSTRLSKG